MNLPSSLPPSETSAPSPAFDALEPAALPAPVPLDHPAQASAETSLPPPPDDLPWLARLTPEHPRWRIRTFLHHLFELLGRSLPKEWPDVPPQTVGEFTHFLQSRLQPLYEHAERLPALTTDQRFMPRYLGETACYLLRADALYPEAFHDPPHDLIELLSDRPKAIIDFDQLYCSPDTTRRRARRVQEQFDDPACRVLLLGDDDLISVALSLDFQGEIHMVDLDDRLHEYIAAKAPSIHRHKADFILGGMPKPFYQTFDAVLLDPPWDEYRMWCFLQKAIFALKDTPDARIFLSYCPLVLEYHQGRLQRFQYRLAKLGFTFESIETAFNLYDLSPRDLPDFPDRLQRMMPPIESPLLDLLRLVPFGHSQLYTLRRLPFERPSRLRRFFFFWWNSA